MSRFSSDSYWLCVFCFAIIVSSFVIVHYNSAITHEIETVGRSNHAPASVLIHPIIGPITELFVLLYGELTVLVRNRMEEIPLYVLQSSHL